MESRGADVRRPDSESGQLLDSRFVFKSCRMPLTLSALCEPTRSRGMKKS